MFIWIFNFIQNFSYNIFLISAIVGTTLFALRILLTIIGFGEDTDINTDIDSFEMDHNYDSDYNSNSHIIPSLKLFTIHSMSGFLMMFGVAGLACNQYNLSNLYSFLISLLVGIFVMFLTAFIFRGALFFQHPGDVFSINKTIGLVGTVYQRIPNNDKGKIHVVINNITRELLAQSADKKLIESFTLIKIINVIDHETVEVIKLEKDTI